MGPSGSGVLFFRVSPSDVPFFLHLYYFQAPATQATSFIALRPFMCQLLKKEVLFF